MLRESYGDQFVKYINEESPCYKTETNRILYATYTLKIEIYK